MPIPTAVPAAQEATGTKVHGFRLICRLFAAVTTDLSLKQYLLRRAQDGSPLDTEAAVSLIENLLALLPPVAARFRTQEGSAAHTLLSTLQDYPLDNTGLDLLYNNYCSSVPTRYDDGPKLTEFRNNLNRVLKAILTQQKGGGRDFMIFLALCFPLNAGRTDSRFSFEQAQLTEVLRVCLREFDLPVGFGKLPEPDPDTLHHPSCTGDIHELLTVALGLSLQAAFPQKATNLVSGREKARKAFLKYCEDNKSSDPDSLLYRLMAYNDRLENLRINWNTCLSQHRTHSALAFRGDLDQIYEIPGLQPLGRTPFNQIMGTDLGASPLKVLLIGSQVGKSTLLKMAELCCVRSHEFFRIPMENAKAFDRIASWLGIRRGGYFPLLLHCAQASANDRDPVAAAVEQFLRELRELTHNASIPMEELNRSLLLDLCRHQLAEERLLILADDWDLAPEALHQALMQPDPHLGVILTATHPMQDELRALETRAFARWVIDPFAGRDRQSYLDRIAPEPELVDGLLEKNRCLRIFCDTHQRIQELAVCRDGDWDRLVSQSISRKLELLAEQDYDTVSFFRRLALCSVEHRWNDMTVGASRSDLRRDPNNIPSNLFGREFYRRHFADLESARRIWEQATRRSLIVCHADVPSAYRFENPLLRYSLAADGYLELLQSGQGEGLVARLSRLEPEDFSYVAVLTMERLCGVEDESVLTDREKHSVLELAMAIAGYVMSLETPAQAQLCRWALEDILCGAYRANLLADPELNPGLLRRSRSTLLRCLHHLERFCA